MSYEWIHFARVKRARHMFGDLADVEMAFGGARPRGRGFSVFYARTQREAEAKARRWAQRNTRNR
jgi:hypothetical protein